jgi:hypothetical protein
MDKIERDEMDKIERDCNNQPTDEAKNHKIFAIEERFQNLGFT